MSLSKKLFYRYLTKRGLATHSKKVRRRNKLKRYYLGYKSAKTIKSKKKERNLKLGSIASRKNRISHGSNIKHIISLFEKIDLRKYKSRYYSSERQNTSEGKNSFLKRRNRPDQLINLEIPEIFSLADSPEPSFDFIYSLFSVLYWGSALEVRLDYSKCKRIDVDAQVFMDVVLNDFFSYYNKCRKHRKRIIEPEVNLTNYGADHIIKILFSIGTLKLFNGIKISFPDILTYDLCIHNKQMKGSPREISSQKEIHVTNILDYVITCLDRMGKKLTAESLNELCQVVGEILINAEEHATTNNRFSIGLFEEKMEEGNHLGLFNLVIFNFGQTIYEKFKDPDCPTKDIVKRMEALSDNYTKGKLFRTAEFEEETLWTLYALQEGITSKTNYKKRGNGSIRFIESFFKLTGTGLWKDGVSKMTIHSGNARIVFDGQYPIREITKNEEKFKVITFNDSNNIEDRPDKNFVTFVPDYFPGTIISAKILIREDSLDALNGVNKVEKHEFHGNISN
jgi:hypothetical protein